MPTHFDDRTVADVLAASPGAARVFIDRGMHCLGCPFAPFDTVADAAFVYHVDLRELHEALIAAASATPPDSGAPAR